MVRLICVYRPQHEIVGYGPFRPPLHGNRGKPAVISSISMTNLRGIREGKLEKLTPLVVLVGPNGCGKSTVLDAMFVAGSVNVQHATNWAIQRHQGVERGAHWFLWRAQQTKHGEIVLETQEGVFRRCELDLQSPTRLRCSVHDPKSVKPSRQSHGELAGVSDIRLIEPQSFPTVPPLHELYTSTVEQGRRTEAKAIIAEVVPHVHDIEILTEGNKPILHLVFEDHSVPVALAGDGVHSLVRLCLELASRPQGTILLEEPEVHQHPGAIRQTVRAILAAIHRHIQVVITTHSLELIDMLLADASEEDLEALSLYRLHLEKGVLTSCRMPGPEVAFARTEIENDLR